MVGGGVCFGLFEYLEFSLDVLLFFQKLSLCVCSSNANMLLFSHREKRNIKTSE